MSRSPLALMDLLTTGGRSMTNQIYVLSVDPGKMSGVSLLSWQKGQEPSIIWSTEIDEKDFPQQIRSAIAQARNEGVELKVVCERFIINAATAKKSQAPYSLELIGMLKLIMMDNGYTPEYIAFQSPADAKSMFPNEKLKKLDIWHKGGEGHALDSLRHAMVFIVKSGWIPLKLLS